MQGDWLLVSFYKSFFGSGLPTEGIWEFRDISNKLKTIIKRRVGMGALVKRIWQRVKSIYLSSQPFISGCF